MPMTHEKSVLIVDDDRDIGDMIQQMLVEQTDYKVLWIAEADLALKAAPLVSPSLILLDYRMPMMLGLEWYDRLQRVELLRNVPVIVISGYSNLPFDQLRERGIHVLKKPFEMDDLLDMVAALVGV